MRQGCAGGDRRGDKGCDMLMMVGLLGVVMAGIAVDFSGIFGGDDEEAASGPVEGGDDTAGDPSIEGTPLATTSSTVWMATIRSAAARATTRWTAARGRTICMDRTATISCWAGPATTPLPAGRASTPLTARRETTASRAARMSMCCAAAMATIP